MRFAPYLWTLRVAITSAIQSDFVRLAFPAFSNRDNRLHIALCVDRRRYVAWDSRCDAIRFPLPSLFSLSLEVNVREHVCFSAAGVVYRIRPQQRCFQHLPLEQLLSRTGLNTLV